MTTTNRGNRRHHIPPTISLHEQQARRRAEAREQYAKRHSSRGSSRENDSGSGRGGMGRPGTKGRGNRNYQKSYRNEGENRRSHQQIRTQVHSSSSSSYVNSDPTPVSGLPHVVPSVDTFEDAKDYLSDSMSLLSVDDTLNTGYTASKKAQKKHRKQKRKMHAKIVELQNQVDILTGELETKQFGNNAKMEKIAAQRDAAMEMVQKKDADLGRMMEMVKDMQRHASEKEKNDFKEKKESEEKYMMMKFEYRALKQSLAAEDEKRESHDAELKALQNEVLQLRSNMSAYSGQLQLEKELRAKSERNEDMERNERISMSASMVAMAKEHAVKEAKFKVQFEEEILSLQDELEAREVELRSKNEEIAAQREKLTMFEEECNMLKASLNERNRTEGNIIEENAHLHGEVALLKDQLKMNKSIALENESALKLQIDEISAKAREGEALRRRLHNTIQELRGNVRVFARVRPFLPIDNVTDDATPSIACRDESCMTIVNEGGDGQHTFKFDRVFPAVSTQANVFAEVSEFVQSALDGFHVTLFSYGQTGSGKTHTMQGLRSAELKGIIPRAMEQVGICKRGLEQEGWKYEMEVSMLEIYNETIRDLLRDDATENTSYDIKVDSKTGERSVTNLNRIPLDPSDVVAINRVMETAAKYRSVGATGMNQTSSRSHSVFTLHLKAVHSGLKQRIKGTLNLVDLAGSERLDRSGATGAMAKETAAINKSLSSLTDVFAAIGKKAAHIPFRNSKLTYLLQPSFSGNGKTLMMVNLSPTFASYSESLSSLRFAKQVNQCELGKAKKSLSVDVSNETNDDMSISSNSTSGSSSGRLTSTTGRKPGTTSIRRPAARSTARTTGPKARPMTGKSSQKHGASTPASRSVRPRNR